MPRHKSARQATAVATLYLAYRDIQHTGSVRSQAAPMQTFHFFSFHSHGLLPLRICTWGEIQGMPPAGSRPEFWSGVALLYRLSQRKQWAPSNGLGRLRREGTSRGGTGLRSYRAITLPRLASLTRLGRSSSCVPPRPRPNPSYECFRSRNSCRVLGRSQHLRFLANPPCGNRQWPKGHSADDKGHC